MHVSRIELSGFKSFARHTVLTFDKGVTCVVGPNGSGKSNVADAIRWVVGEQSTKSLRSGSSEDLIFAGSDAKRRSALAEVSITFDNQDNSAPITYKEFTITRRVDRSGTSTYLLNKTKTRLIDIKELLAKAGFAGSTYSIISQGTVDKLITATPKERRDILEDAAGIRPYKLRRGQASLKLAASKRNLEQTSLQLEELTPLVKSLERQAKRAAKQEALLQERDTLVRHVFGHQYASAMAVGAAARTQMKQIHAQMSEHESHVAGFESSINELRSTLKQARTKRSELDTQLQEHEQSKRNLLERQSLLKGRLQAAIEADSSDDIERIEQQIAELKASLHTKHQELKGLAQTHESAQAEFTQAEQALANAQEALKSLRSEQSSLESKRSELQRVSSNAYDPSRDQSDAERLSESLTDHKATYAKLQHDITTTQSDAAQHAKTIKTHESTLTEIDASTATLQQTIDALELPEEEGLSVNDIRDKLARVVSQERAVIEASRRCHSERELRSIFTHIERTHADLADLYEFLQQQTGDESSESVRQLLEARDQLAETQTKRMRAHESLQTARTAAAVTQERLQSYLATQERLEQDIAHSTAELEEVQRRLAQHTESSNQHNAEAQISHINEQLQALEQAIEQTQTTQNEQQVSLNEAQRALIEAETRRQTTEEQFDTTVQQLESAHQALQDAQQNAQASNGENAKALKIENDLTDLEKQLEAAQKQINDLLAQQQDLNTATQSKRQELSRVQSEQNSARDQIAALSQSAHAHDVMLARVDEQLKALNADMIEHCGIETTIELQTAFCHTPFTLQQHDFEQQTKRFATVERELAKIGDIPTSISTEYQEANERFTYLSTQREDALQACETLESSIKSLDRRINTQFNEMFNKIQSSFGNTFTQLFNGGSGTISKERVRIDNPSDESADPDTAKTEAQYEDQIEITVTPPGKSLASISALSGGEKALASIALLLAIIEHNPSPFIVLDEVDAALDEANAEHFARVIKTASQHSQFIVVTHARATMQQAHTLYGITMQEAGISTALSLQLDHATKLVDQKKIERATVAS